MTQVECRLENPGELVRGTQYLSAREPDMSRIGSKLMAATVPSRRMAIIPLRMLSTRSP